MSDRVDVANYWDLEGLLPAMGDDSKHAMVVRVEMPPIEKESGVQDSRVDITLDICNYLWL